MGPSTGGRFNMARPHAGTTYNPNSNTIDVKDENEDFFNAMEDN